jgi:putative oxidoreductase
MTKLQNTICWVAQAVAALILGQTLFFKFSGARESVAIFETLGAEPWGRIGSGIMELFAVILLLSPRFSVYGGILTLMAMTGAIGAHLTKLGIEVGGDGGGLFAMALITFVAGAIVTICRRRQLPFFQNEDRAPNA